MIHSLQNTAIQEVHSNLFELNATMPIIAIQLLILMLILDRIFYNRIKKTLENRKLLIHNAELRISELIAQASLIRKKNEEKLKNNKKEATQRENLAKSRAEEKVNAEIQKTQEETEQFIAKTINRLKLDKEKTLQIISKEINSLSKDIVERILNATTRTHKIIK